MAQLPSLTDYRHITDGEMSEIKARVANKTATSADFNATRAYAYQNGYPVPQDKSAMLPEDADRPVPPLAAHEPLPATVPTTGPYGALSHDAFPTPRPMMASAPAPTPMLTPMAGPMAADPTPAPVPSAASVLAPSPAPLAAPPTAGPMASGGSGGLADYYSQLEQERGLPAGYLGKVRHIESSDGTNLVNPNSSARGDFQFMKSTAAQYGIDPMDPRASAKAAADMAVQNRVSLANSLGVDPSSITGGQLYLAHQQGAGGAAKLLQSGNEPGSASSILGDQASSLNGGAGLSGAQMSNKWISAYNGAQPNYDGKPPITVNPNPPQGAMASDAPPPGAPVQLAGAAPGTAPSPDLASLLNPGAPGGPPSFGDGLKMLGGAAGGGGKSSAPPMQMPAPADAHSPDMNLASLLARKKMAYGIGVNPALQSPLMGALG